MLTGLASQVRDLKTSKAARQFKQDKLKILLIGNCVVNKMATLFSYSRHIDTLFFSNLFAWGNYHEESFFERADQADLIVSLDSHGKLRHDRDFMSREYGDKCFFVPRVRVDGMDALQIFSSSGNAIFFGGANIVEKIKSVGFDQARESFIKGQLSTEPLKRFKESISALERLETRTIRISDYILEYYKRFPIMNAVGHPSSPVVSTLFKRLVAATDTQARVDILNNKNVLGRLELPETPRVLSPYVVEEMNFYYAFDPKWLLVTDNLLPILNSKIKRNIAALPGDETI